MDFIRDDKFIEKEKELFQLITSAVSFRQSQRDKEYMTNMAHYEGLHWNLAENKVDSPFLLRSDINHLKNAVDIRLGSLCSEKYWGELKPLSPSDVESIEDLNVLYKNEWNRLSADDLVEYVVKYGAICDNGYVAINFDTSKIIGGTNTKREGAITLEPLETSNVYLDPTASNIDECEYMVVKTKKSKMWVKRNKPEWLKIFKDLNIDTGTEDPSASGEVFVGRNYAASNANQYDIDILYRKEVEDRDVDVTDDDNKVVGKDKVRAIRIKEYYFVSKHLIDINEKYPFDEFPVIPFQWEAEPQSPYGIPLLRGLTVPQKVANLIESAANNIAMHYTVPTWLISAESGVDISKFAKLSNALGMAWKVNGDVAKAIKQMDPPQINKDLIEIKNSFVENIKLHAGTTDTYIGAIGTAGSTAEGTLSAINRATVIDNPVIKQIEKFVEKLSRMIIRFMTRYYKDQTIYIRDTEKEEKSYSFKSLKVDKKFEKVKYEFYVDLASRSKTDKNRQYTLMKELYTIQNQYKEDKRIINVADLVKAANLDNYNEMYKRFSDMSEEAFAEKADLIVQIMSIGQTMTPNGTPLISAEEMQEGIMDVLDDNGDLSVVENIFNTYEQYQTQVTELNNQIAARQQQAQANEYIDASNAQTDLAQQLLQGRNNIMLNGLPEENTES